MFDPLSRTRILFLACLAAAAPAARAQDICGGTQDLRRCADEVYHRRYASPTAEAHALECGGRPYNLAQATVPGGDIFFFDATLNSWLVFEPLEGVRYGGVPDTGSNAGVMVRGETVASSVDSWIDKRGFVHTVDVLKRQISFNRWRRHFGARADALPVTGIMDRRTMWAESVRLHEQLAAVRQKMQVDSAGDALRQACADGSAADASLCADPRSSSVAPQAEAAAAALARYDAALAAVRFKVPAPLHTPCNSIPEIGEDAPCCDLVRAQQLDIIGRYPQRAYVRGSNEPEDGVTEEVDGSSIDPLAKTLTALEAEARGRMHDAASLAGVDMDGLAAANEEKREAEQQASEAWFKAAISR